MKLECLPQKAKRGELLVAHGRKNFSARSRDDGGFGGTIRVGKVFWLTAKKKFDLVKSTVFDSQQCVFCLLFDIKANQNKR